ncbi:hypothetical protein [Paraburkholderia sp. J12]|uniref:hypothetical protein n=1 Tax=Paraburkholderia sp. J12 TaxID=2805432 RepID=UPI002ABD41D4|nr:hypothetical protein [Paraburkholderia sp. J12]
MRTFRARPDCPGNAARRTRVLLSLLALFAGPGAYASDTDATATPCAKADAGYVLEDSKRASFGSTNPVQACIDVLSPQNEEGPRRLRIFVDGKRVISNDAVALGPDEEGANGGPFVPLEISHGSLIVRNATGGGPLRVDETWRLTNRGGQWVVAGWDIDGSDSHSAADSGGEFHTSVNALTGAIQDSYDPPEDDPANTKRSTRHSCTLPAGWRSPPLSQIGAIRNRSWHCDPKLGKPL